MEQNTATLIAVVILVSGVGCWFVSIWLARKFGKVSLLHAESLVFEDVKPQAVFAGVLKSLVSGAKILEHVDTKITVRRLGCTDPFEVVPYENGAKLNVHCDSQDFTKYCRLIIVLWNYLVIPLAIAGMTFIIWKFVIHSPNPHVRYQVFQTIHIIHFLWPPFAIYYLHRAITAAQKRITEDIHALVKGTKSVI